jgi:release factor glutamine methyltransferase
MMVTKIILKKLHPALKYAYRWYASTSRTFKYGDIRIKILPGVFHPGLFFSTRTFLEFLQSIDLKSRTVLELGSGTGLIAIYCNKRGAHVTASDISSVAVHNTVENCRSNSASVHVIQSDLFATLTPNSFDIILINPPYYPKKVIEDTDHAWFCGENFQYFIKLFQQLHLADYRGTLYMVLSDDCDDATISKIGNDAGFRFTKVFQKKSFPEENYIFKIDRSGLVHNH